MLLIYLNFSYFFFLMFLLNLIFMMKLILLKLKLFIEFNLINFNSMNYSLMIYFDYKSLIFISVVNLISSMIIIYSIEYMFSDLFNIRFIYILVLFVFSMIMMIIGQNLLMILLGWDGLGLISYCLVIYYNNWSSFNSGMLTILTNRLGDIGLLISISIYMILGDLNYLMLESLNIVLLIFMIFLACFTKSAQIPFSSWLPVAMAAPTPISSLVHSSTLVTAGVYLLIRFNKILIMNMMLLKFFILLSLMTMLFSSLIASFENDFKKIIALSTLSQLGMMMIGVLMKLNLISFFHLITHAMFKSLLFMCAGLILHSMINNQDIRNLGLMNLNYLFTLCLFNCSSLALIGFPFMSGFYSKDLILEMLMYLNMNFFFLLMFFLSLMFTMIYSFRLIYYMILNFLKFYNSMINFNDNIYMNSSMILLFLFSIISGSLLNWLFFNSMNNLFFNKFLKLLILIMMLFSFLKIFFMFELKIKFKLKILFLIFNSMIMMNYFSNFYMKNILILSNLLMMNIEKGFLENLILMIKKKYLSFFLLNNFILKNFISFLMIMLIIFCFI